MEVVGMGPGGFITATQRDADNERWLAAAKEAFPGWDFHQVMTGWMAVPAGATVIQALTLDGIVEKLRQHENGLE